MFLKTFIILVTAEIYNGQLTEVYSWKRGRVGWNGTVFTETISYHVSSEAVDSNGIFDNGKITDLKVQVVIHNVTAYSNVSLPVMTLSKAVKLISKDGEFAKIAVTLTMVPSTGMLNVDLTDECKPHMQTYYHSTYPQNANFENFANQILRWQLYNVTKMVSIKFNTQMVNNTVEAFLEKSKIICMANMWYSDVLDTHKGSFIGPTKVSVCMYQKGIQHKKVHKYSYIILVFFIALLLGIILTVILIAISFLYWPKYQVTPCDVEHLGIIISGRKNMEKFSDIHKSPDYLNESIVRALSLDSSLKVEREINNWDISSTQHVETIFERERDDGSSHSIILLIQGLQHNNVISERVTGNCISSFKKSVADLNRKLEKEYKDAQAKLFKEISIRNKAMFSELQRKHKAEQEELKGNPDSAEYIEQQKLMKEEHKVKTSNLAYKLKLEQEEDKENLRKEFSVRKRIGLKDLRDSFLNMVKEQGQLSKEQNEWMVKQNEKNQELLSQQVDKEMTRLRTELEEKMAKRRGHAQLTVWKDLASKDELETLKVDSDEILNTIADQQSRTVEEIKNQGLLSSEQIEKFLDNIQANMIGVKEKMVKTQEIQEKELHKTLTNSKKQKLDQLRKQHQGEIAQLEKKQAQKKETDPDESLTYVQERLDLLSKQQQEWIHMEEHIDEEHTHKLHSTHISLVTKAKKELESTKDKLITKINQEGADDQVIGAMLEQHKSELNEIESIQEMERQRLEADIQEKLTKKKREWNENASKEGNDQSQLREYENKVVTKLVNSQLVMSEEERRGILQEHEKHMVKLENCFTLTKLRQQKLLEERLAKNRARKLEELQVQQENELQRQKEAPKSTEESDDEVHRKQLALMKEHANQRLAALCEQKVDSDVLLQEVRVQMLSERADALKQQEEQLGSLIAKLQLEKAKELTRIEEQQKTINNLKTNIIDELSEKGILNDPECKEIIEIHRKNQEQINALLDAEKKQQETNLKERLLKRQLQRKKTVVDIHESEMNSVKSSAPSKLVAKIQQVMLMHKQMLELEQFQNQMDCEVEQAIEEIHQQHKVKLLKIMQDQEMQLLQSLLRIGMFGKTKLYDVLQSLFPEKSQEELSKLQEELSKNVNNTTSQPTGTGDTSLEDRLKEPSSEVSEETSKKARKTSLEDEITESTSAASPKKIRVKRQKKKLQRIASSDEDEKGLSQNSHNKDSGQVEKEFGQGIFGTSKPNTFPPLTGKKKKKSLLKKFVKVDST